MSDMAKKARAAMKERAQRRAEPAKGDIDASGWREPLMETGKKTGAAPITKRAFKRGGKVNLKAEGAEGMKHAGKKPRGKHDDVVMDKKLIKSMVSKKALKKADGGQTVNRAGKGDYAGSYPADLSNSDLAKIRASQAAQGKKEQQWQNTTAVGKKKGGRAGKDAGGFLKGIGNAATTLAKYGPLGGFGGNLPSTKDYLKFVMGGGKKRGGKVHDKGCACKACGGRMGRASGGDVDDTPPDAMAGRYDEDAVNKAIASSNRSGNKIGKKEAALIHSLLKGRAKPENGGNADSDDQFKHPYFGDVRQYEGKKWDEEKEKWVDKKGRTERKDGGRTKKKGGGGGFGIDNPFKGKAGNALDMGAQFLSPAYALARGKPPGMLGMVSGLMGKKSGGKAGKGNYAGGTRPTGGRIAKQGGGSLGGQAAGQGAPLRGGQRLQSVMDDIKGMNKSGSNPISMVMALARGLRGGDVGDTSPFGSFSSRAAARATPAGGATPYTTPASPAVARKSGGRTKAEGKTNIHIKINAAPKPDAMGMPMPLPPMPLKPPPGLPPAAAMGAPGMMPPAGGPPMPPAGGAPMGLPPGAPPMMGRKAGGRVYRSYKDMDAGAGGGLGRLEKAEIQKSKR